MTWPAFFRCRVIGRDPAAVAPYVAPCPIIWTGVTVDNPLELLATPEGLEPSTYRLEGGASLFPAHHDTPRAYRAIPCFLLIFREFRL